MNKKGFLLVGGIVIVLVVFIFFQVQNIMNRQEDLERRTADLESRLNAIKGQIDEGVEYRETMVEDFVASVEDIDEDDETAEIQVRLKPKSFISGRTVAAIMVNGKQKELKEEGGEYRLRYPCPVAEEQNFEEVILRTGDVVERESLGEVLRPGEEIFPILEGDGPSFSIRQGSELKFSVGTPFLVYFSSNPDHSELTGGKLILHHDGNEEFLPLKVAPMKEGDVKSTPEMYRSRPEDVYTVTGDQLFFTLPPSEGYEVTLEFYNDRDLVYRKTVYRKNDEGTEEDGDLWQYFIYNSKGKLLFKPYIQ